MSRHKSKFSPPFFPTSGEDGVKIVSSFRDVAWAAYGERLEVLINNYKLKLQRSRPFILDFSQCTWADPVPLLSVLLFGGQLTKESYQVKFVITPSSELTEADKFPVFFMKHGFFEATKSVGIEVCDTEGNRIEREEKLEYLTKEAVLTYRHPVIIPAKISVLYKFNWSESFASNYINKIVECTRSAYEPLVHRSVITGLLYRTQVVIEETIQNVFDHAYPDSSSVVYAIFARYREGRKNLESGNVEDWNSRIREEQDSCPYLDRAYLESKEGCIEVFVVDLGQGIARSFGEDANSMETRRQYRELLKKVFTVGESSKQHKRADAGGLTVIHNQMIPSRDYLRVYDSGVWIGIPGGLNRPNRNIESTPLDTGAVLKKGVAWTIRLGLRGDANPGLDWPLPSEKELGNVIEVFRLNNTLEDKFQPEIIDSRFKDFNYQTLKISNTQSSMLIWLPQPHLGKDDVRAFYKSVSDKLDRTKKWTLVIADIRTHEGTVFFDALHGRAEFYDQHVSNIYLVTERLQYRRLILTSMEGQLRYSATDSADIDLHGAIEVAGFFPELVKVLRRHDSQIVWKEALSKQETYIHETISWGVSDEGKDIEISGYLNVGLLYRSRTVKNAAMIALERVVGAMRAVGDEVGKPVVLNSADVLVANYCENFNSIGDRYTYNKKRVVLLGSVLVTGKTIQSLDKVGAPNSIHLFHHGHVSNAIEDFQPVTAFEWHAPILANNQMDTKRMYERVGSSHSISRKGSNHYIIPKKKNNGEYFAERSPSQFYADIQRVAASAIRVGHWVYRDNHDILGINMRLFIRDAFDRKNDLYKYLVKHLLVDTGVPRSYFIQSTRKMVDDLWPSEDVFDERGIIVYPAHTVTEKIISRLLDCLNARGRKRTEEYFVPVNRLRNKHKHMASLLSPQSEEELLVKQRLRKVTKIVLFDDGIVSGHTKSDLFNLISPNHVENIEMVTILNRMREPGWGVASRKVTHYWRVDLPRLGNSESCIICKALGEANYFNENYLTSHRAKKRVGEWVVEWREVDPNREWSGSGLRPLVLSEPITKRMGKGLGVLEEEEDLVRIENSTALSLFDIELTTMTGLDDHIERLLSRIENMDSQVEIEIVATHLLLFSNDLPPELRTTLLRRILRLLLIAKGDDARSSLACLIIMVYAPKHMVNLEKDIVDTIKREGVSLETICFDASILFSYLYTKGMLNQRLFFRSIRLLGTPSKSVSRMYNDLYFETRGPYGNPHLLPIQVLAKEKVSRDDYPRVRLGALDQIDKLEQLIYQLEERMARSGDLSELPNPKASFDNIRKHGVERSVIENEIMSFTQTREKGLSTLFNTKKMLRGDPGGLYFLRSRDSEKTPSGVEICKKTMECLEEFRRKYFFLELSISEIRRGQFEKEFINKIFDSISWGDAVEAKRNHGVELEKPMLRTTLIIGEDVPEDLSISIVFDYNVSRVMNDLLMNTGYAGKDGDGVSYADIKTIFNKDCVVVEMSNICKGSARDVVKRANRPLKWDLIKEIGGGVSYSFDEDNHVIVSVNIPYAGFCRGGEIE
ncbi:MAG: hypothetical protein LPH21_10595 [Shewanella sp.]|nr:hypothetical protein [Shewanella sp.]MCG7935431.1 hypothetical protein [Candidatus Thiodiazotropha taylori]